MSDGQTSIPTASELAAQVATAMDAYRILAEAAAGHRAYLESLGFSPTAAEQMAMAVYLAAAKGAR